MIRLPERTTPRSPWSLLKVPFRRHAVSLMASLRRELGRSLARKSKEFEEENEWEFNQTNLGMKATASPFFGKPKTLLAKGSLENSGCRAHHPRAESSSVLMDIRFFVPKLMRSSSAMNAGHAYARADR